MNRRALLGSLPLWLFGAADRLSALTQPAEKIPRGKRFTFTHDDSRLFPGTRREISVYVPAQYKADNAACVYVGLDGLLFRDGAVTLDVGSVFDVLISERAMPPTVAVGVPAGVVESAQISTDPRFNRSLEFDSLSARLGDFLLEEILPKVESMRTNGADPIRLSQDPNDRAVGGRSTGGIGAFTVGWENPQAFRRVFSAIGTFVGMRGGDHYPVLVRKSEPKPLRVFLQDGSNDQWDGGPEMGDWWMGNQALARALAFSGYAVKHAWGKGAHELKDAAAAFPDAMRWLWKDWPAPVTAGASQNTFLKHVVIGGEGWSAIPETHEDALLIKQNTHRARGCKGQTYYTVRSKGQLWLSPANAPDQLLDSQLREPTGVALSPDGLWLAVAENRGPHGYSYRVNPDGSVSQKQRFYEFELAADADESGAGDWIADRDGRLYAATSLGVQVFDHNGRVRAILSAPSDMPLATIGFGGADSTSLVVGTTDHHYYRRRLQVGGASSQSCGTVPNWGEG